MTGATDTERPLDGRRGEIAAAARSLIAERGFEGLRTRDIADRVGINIATLHYHVPTKEALIQLVAESLRDEFRAQFMRNPREGLTGWEQLQLEFADFRETLSDNREAFTVLAELASRAKRDEKVAEVMRPLQAFWLKMVTDIVEHGRQDGSFRPDVDPKAAASMIIGAMIGSQREGESIEFYDRVVAELGRAIRNTSPKI